MNGKQQQDTGRQGPENRHLPLFPSAARRTMPVLVSLFLLSGCATFGDQISNWVPVWSGGEGKPAQNVRSRDETDPVAAELTRKKIMAMQADLTALGYNPGRVDGVWGSRTEKAVKAFQKDAGMTADGVITQELADRLAAAAGRDLPPADMIHVENAHIPPRHDAGDAYIWSNGEVETVVRAAGNNLFWRTDNGHRYTADSNFLIPPSSWAGPSGSGEADARLEGRKSWPLHAGSPLEFEVASDGLLAKWRCSTAGTRRVTVPAGQFDVIALACERNPAPAGDWVRRVWLYAPEVRHYVARTDIMADGSRDSIELVGVRPGAEDWPPAARAGLDRAIRDALDDLPDGKNSRWSSTFVKEEFEILLGSTHDTGAGERCRNFELIAHGAGISRIYPAQACISGDAEKWRIPADTGAGSDGNSFLTSAN